MKLLSRRWLRELRHAPDRMVHPMRRSRVRRSIARRGGIRSVLFLCHGNVCRSPYAAGSFARLAGASGGVRVASAGFIGPDRSSPALALEAARRRGIDMSTHRSTLVTDDAIRSADLIVVMSAEQAREVVSRFGARRVVVLGDLDPLPIRRRTVLDPWDGDSSAFDESYDRIDRCLGALVRALGEID